MTACLCAADQDVSLYFEECISPSFEEFITVDSSCVIRESSSGNIRFSDLSLPSTRSV